MYAQTLMSSDIKRFKCRADIQNPPQVCLASWVLVDSRNSQADNQVNHHGPIIFNASKF